MNTTKQIMKIFFFIGLIFFTLSARASSPLWTFTPLTATTVAVPSTGTAIVQYQITNQSRKAHTLIMQAITGITQITTGSGICRSPFVLAGNASCTLSLQINGNQLTQPISSGPIVCEQGSILQCYRPAVDNILRITQAPPNTTDATISVSGSPLTLTTNGSTGTLTINNTSSIVTATNITSQFTGTALDGNVIETENTCATVPPQASCTITYIPGGNAVSQTDFTIQGTNTNAATAAIQIDSGVSLTSINPTSGSASGGTGVTLTGTGLTGATSITFGGIAATSINVINSTTVTAVTATHAAGVVDVAITTPSGSTTNTNGFTYLTTAVGQSVYGGNIACLNGGLNNLIAATVDNSTNIEWGGLGITTSATSNTDGATNTATTVSVLGGNGGTPYAAQLCSDYEVDSQGNTPCESGNTCYNDWFLPAGNNSTASGQLNCLFTNRVAIGGFSNTIYRSSTESTANNAWVQNFSNGSEVTTVKSTTYNVRCVRAFVP